MRVAKNAKKERASPEQPPAPARSAFSTPLSKMQKRRGGWFAELANAKVQPTASVSDTK